MPTQSDIQAKIERYGLLRSALRAIEASSPDASAPEAGPDASAPDSGAPDPLAPEAEEIPPPGEVRSETRILADLSRSIGRPLGHWRALAWLWGHAP